MTKRSVFILVLFIVSLTVAASTAAVQVDDKTVVCPVSGKEMKAAEAAASTEYEGKTYYFCCENCKAKFLADPEKYIAAGMHEGCGAECEQAEMAHKEHAGHGMKMKMSEAQVTAEYNGQTYSFCSEACKEKFLADPEKYIASGMHEGCGAECMKAEMAHKEHARHGMKMKMSEAVTETVDPVCGMKIEKSEAKATAESNGQTYYFCSEACKAKFLADPDKYVQQESEMVTCPVSGETFAKNRAAGSSEYNGQTYYFCCAGCKAKFDKDPAAYAGKKSAVN